MLDQSGRPTPGPSQKEGSKIGGTGFLIPCTINIMLTGEQPLCSQTCPTFILTRAHKTFFLEKNATLPLALCLWWLRRWHYGGISGIFGRFFPFWRTNGRWPKGKAICNSTELSIRICNPINLFRRICNSPAMNIRICNSIR